MMQQHRFVVMDGLRGVAALLVVSLHVSQAGGVSPPLPAAYLAVDLFFMLSGFVIALAYEERLKAGMSPLEFAWARVRRLYPLIILGGLLAMLAAFLRYALIDDGLYTLETILKDGFKGALLIPRLRGEDFFYPLNVAMWSLMFEFIANFAYAVFLWRLPVRTLSAIAIVGAGGVAYSICERGHANVGSEEFLYGLARVTWGFLVGVVIYRFCREREYAPHQSSVLGLTIIALFAATTAWQADSWVNGVGLVAIVLFIMPALVVGATMVDISSTSASAGTCSMLGYVSYPLYAIHMPILRIGELAAGTQQIMQISLIAVACVPLAYVAARYWDEPIQRLLRRPVGFRENVSAETS